MKLNQGDVEKIVKRVVDEGLSTAYVAGQFSITQRESSAAGEAVPCDW